MAIAFDNCTTQNYVSGTSLTFSHTVGSGSNRFLVVFTSVGSPAGDFVTGITYNGVAMTQVKKFQESGGNSEWYYAYVLANPATGANNVVISTSSTTFISGGALSYTGVKQSNSADATGAKSDNVNNFVNNSVTTVADNDWVATYGRTYSGTLTASTNVTERGTIYPSVVKVGDNNAAVTPAGSLAQQWNGVGECVIVQVAFAPAPPITDKFFMLFDNPIR